MERIDRLRKHRHLLLTKTGELNDAEKQWLAYLNEIFEGMT